MSEGGGLIVDLNRGPLTEPRVSLVRMRDRGQTPVSISLTMDEALEVELALARGRKIAAGEPNPKVRMVARVGGPSRKESTAA